MRETFPRRDSPWGPIVVADAHIHFFSHGFFTKLVAQKPGLTLESAAEKLGWEMPPRETEGLANLWFRELDRHRVSVAALIASLPGEEASVVAAARMRPERFRAFAMVNPRAWDPQACSEIRVACLFPAMHLFSIGDDCVRPVFEWAEQGRRAIFVHCGVLSVGARRSLGLPSQFDLRYSNPIDLHSVALRHPSVPIIVPHFGAGYMREALMLGDLCPNVYLDTSSSNQWMRYFGLSLPQVFRRALDVMGAGRLLFGTDSSFFPRGWNEAVFEEQVQALDEIGVNAHDAQAIFADNLVRILPA